MRIKKIICLGVLVLGLAFVGTPTTTFASEDLDSTRIIKDIRENYQNVEVQNRLIEKVKNGELLDSINPDKKQLGITKVIDPYTQVTAYPDGSEEEIVIDFSEATFYDENGNVIENVDNDQITPYYSDIEGGSWNSGSGYSCVTGAKVSAYNLQLTMSFKADFCNNKSTYDNISRIYAVDITAPYWEVIDSGVFRSNETFEYSAYGGVKLKYRLKSDGLLFTGHSYLRVGNDTYWVDTSI